MLDLLSTVPGQLLSPVAAPYGHRLHGDARKPLRHGWLWRRQIVCERQKRTTGGAELAFKDWDAASILWDSGTTRGSRRAVVIPVIHNRSHLRIFRRITAARGRAYCANVKPILIQPPF